MILAGHPLKSMNEAKGALGGSPRGFNRAYTPPVPADNISLYARPAFAMLHSLRPMLLWLLMLSSRHPER